MLVSAFQRQPPDAAALRESLVGHVRHTLGEAPVELSEGEAFRAAGLAVRDFLIDGLLATQERYRRAGAKRLYYLSLEFLIGRSLHNKLVSLGLVDAGREALAAVGADLGAVEDREPDAALGNGGLGRLAACFLDSLAT